MEEFTAYSEPYNTQFEWSRKCHSLIPRLLIQHVCCRGPYWAWLGSGAETRNATQSIDSIPIPKLSHALPSPPTPLFPLHYPLRFSSSSSSTPHPFPLLLLHSSSSDLFLLLHSSYSPSTPPPPPLPLLLLLHSSSSSDLLLLLLLLLPICSSIPCPCPRISQLSQL